jgi:hypothetical protein
VELLDRFSLGPKKFKNFSSNSVALQRISGIEFWVFDFGVSTLLAKCTLGILHYSQKAPPVLNP